MARHLRLASALGALLFGLLAGCTCGEPPGQPNNGVCSSGAKACNNTDECPARHVCRKDPKSGEACCTRTQRTCTEDVECCPGQTCNRDGLCADKYDECEDDDDCGDRVCEDWVDPLLGKTRRCTSPRCGAGDTCTAGRSCVAGFCVSAPPCNGSCPAGQACVPQNNRCHPFGTRCDLTPQAGKLIVFTNPDNVYDLCEPSQVACKYVDLPGLPTPDLGRHASATTAGGQVVVAHYDGLYGDLVVSELDGQGTRHSSWVDGVPKDKPLIAGPTGPRGGIGEPGDDVGLYTDLTANTAGALFVSYYDRTRGDLRFLSRSSAGAWQAPHTVDGADADVGLYTSVALDSEGKPAIAYFQRAGTDASPVCASAPGAPKTLLTAVKLARAKVLEPKAASDWDIQSVSGGARPPPPCHGCAADQTCVAGDEDVSLTTCEPPSTACTPACASGTVCVERTGKGVCVTPGNPVELEGTPKGRGLFPSLAFKGATPVIAWYDQLRGNLVVSQPEGTGWKETVLDGEERGADTGDVGLFPSLAWEPNLGFHIAYVDATRRGLRYYNSSTLDPLAEQATPRSSSFIDKGTPAQGDGPSWVGADASLAITPFGLYVAYQNATGNDLRLARRDSQGWRVVKEWTEGAVGFYADAVPLNGTLYVAHARLHAQMVEGKAVADNQLRVELFTP